MEQKYNTRSPAVKRLMREAAELNSATSDYFAAPLEDNLFEWHFTVRGPGGSDFQDGVYHGRIIVPAEYPMKPPDIILLTPNGRFVVGQKICLSISGYHPETWQPSWSIRTALLAIIGFMPTPGQGTIGSLDYTPQERKILAQKSVNWTCDKCGTRPSLLLPPPSQELNVNQEKEMSEIVQTLQFKTEEEMLSKNKKADGTAAVPSDGGLEQASSSSASPETGEVCAAPSSTSEQLESSSAAVSSSPTAGSSIPSNSCVDSSPSSNRLNQQPTETRTEEEVAEDPAPPGLQVYDVMIIFVVLLIAALVIRRFSDQVLEDSFVEDGNEDLTDPTS